MSIRTQRIAEQIRAELSRLLREETHDPRIGVITLTRVKVSPDLSTALIFWSPLALDAEADWEDASRGLESAAGFLRKRLGSVLSLRRTPQLAFRFDPSIEEGSRILSLLHSLPETHASNEDPNTSADDESEGAGPHGEEA